MTTNCHMQRGTGHGRALSGVAYLAALLALPASLPAQGQPAVVGRIEGDDIAVRGQVSMMREAGRKSTTLGSGSEVLVRSGSARLVLADGSEVDVCGPAQFSVLKSGDSVTVAVNSGRVHARLSSRVPVSIYTPLVVATPLSISERPRDVVVGVEGTGGVCARPLYGAVRLEEQLTGASLVVPQGGEVLLPDGQIGSLRDMPESCRCEAVLSEDREPQPARTVQVSIAGLPNPNEKKSEEPKKEELKAPAKEIPTWQVLMPPLTFDAASPQPAPGPNPETVLLLREARVMNGAVLHGRVEERTPSAAASPPAQAKEKSESEKKPSFGTRFKNFFRRLFGGKPSA